MLCYRCHVFWVIILLTVSVGSFLFAALHSELFVFCNKTIVVYSNINNVIVVLVILVIVVPCW